jgi:HNH endonuclease
VLTDSQHDEAGTSFESRFWAKVDKRGADECWPWTASTSSTGYGVIREGGRLDGSLRKAHRVSAHLAGMDISAGLVLHSCDNRLCVNPAHLRVGTHKENAQNAMDRDRVSWGEHRPNTRLTVRQVLAIRQRLALGEGQKSVAAEYGLHPSTISRIATGSNWKRAVRSVQGGVA